MRSAPRAFPCSSTASWPAGVRARSCARAARRAWARAAPRPTTARARLHPTAGATLVAARPPLIAFNLELAAPATLADARGIAALIRSGGAEGLPGVRALGLRLARRDVIQVSTNIEDHRAVTATEVLAAVTRHHAVARAELVAPAPEAAIAGWPTEVELRMPGTIEALLGSGR